MTGPSESWRLCPAGPPHAPVIAALHLAAFGEAWPAADVATILGQPGVLASIACEGGAERAMPVGFVVLRRAGDEAEILSIGVAPAARGRGCATALLASALAQAGPAAVFLEVASDNPAAAALYRRAGFVAVGRRRGYYRRPDGAQDAVVMRRPPATTPGATTFGATTPGAAAPA